MNHISIFSRGSYVLSSCFEVSNMFVSRIRPSGLLRFRIKRWNC